MHSTMPRRFVLGMAFAALAGAAASAQPPAAPGGGFSGGPGGGPRGGPGAGMMGGGMMGGGPGMMGGTWDATRYLDSLKSELAISPAQEPAWKAYADTVSGVAEQMQGLHKTMFESMGTATWQERRTQMNQMFEARQQAFDNVHEAATKLVPA